MNTIDSKVDDGRPGLGMWTTWQGDYRGNGNDCTTDPNPSIVVYELNKDTIGCNFNVKVPQ